MIVRHVVAAVLAFSITIGLFYVMQLLISMGSGRGTDIDKGRVIEFVRIKRDSDLQERKRELPKKEKPPEPPPPPDLQMSSPESADSGEMAIAAPSYDLNPDLGGLNLGTAPSDSDTIPLVRVPPQYPVRAAERGIEGYVVMRFTISAAGTVKDPVVVDSEPARIFDRAAIRAIKKWKYKPKIEDGVAVERPNIEVKLAFNLDGS